MFIRVTTKKHNGIDYHYALLVKNKKVNGKVVQEVVKNFGKVTLDQVPYLKAAYMDPEKRPLLIYKDQEK